MIKVLQFIHKGIVFLIGAVLVVVFVSGILVLGFYLIRGSQWRQDTSPLPQETIDYLCHSFESASADDICQFGGEVYARDFYPYIRDELISDDSQWTTREDIDGILGTYKVACIGLVSNPSGDHECRYDLRGDNRFRLIITYHEDGTISDVSSSMRIAGDSD